MKLISKLIHRVRVFYQRRRARKIIAAMNLDKYKFTSLEGHQAAQWFCSSCESDLVLKIENKRRELGYSNPNETKTFSIQEGNKITWFHLLPNGEQKIVKEIYLNDGTKAQDS